MTDLCAAWAAVHEDTPEGWYVGQPMEHPERNEWSQCAFDTSETSLVGKALARVDRDRAHRTGVRPGHGAVSR